MNFLVHFTNNITLKYQLIDHEIVKSWSTLILSHSIDDCCSNNHYIGYTSDQVIESKIQRLYFLSDLINSHAPDRVIKQEVSKTNWKTALQIMHVHFPDLKNDAAYKHIWNELSEYNDIIHWLESTLGRTDVADSSRFRITLDFNKSNAKFLPIPDSAYNLFCPYINFGYLLLHYTHVGKNAHEIFIHKDLICPVDQFVPQTTFSASIRMYFTDNFTSTDSAKKIYDLQWQNFYNTRGKEFWKYEFNDPKLAFGYIKIGNLISVNENKIPENRSEMINFRKELVNSRIVHWEINGA